MRPTNEQGTYGYAAVVVVALSGGAYGWTSEWAARALAVNAVLAAAVVSLLRARARP